MYSKDIIFGMDLYSILISVGVIVCMIFIRLQADKRSMRGKLQNLVLFNAIAAVVLGYGSAVLLQAFYNYMANGTFEIVNNTGATFYGGLIGGTALFIIIYFVAGTFLFKDGYHKGQFRTVSDLAPAAITVAHGFGRLGCLMAGCCHGKICDVWYALPMNVPGDGTAELVKAIPVQLYEALFLFALSAYLLVTFLKGKKYQMPVYMIAYAIWRFVAEIWRDDYRGETVVSFLSPSQFISVLLLAGGLVLLGIEIYLDERKAKATSVTAAAPETEVASETEAASETEVASEAEAAPETASAPEGETHE